MKKFHQRYGVIKTLLLTLLIILALISIAQGLNNAIVRSSGSQDNQWGPSRVLLQGSNPYAVYLNQEEPHPFILSQYPNYPSSGLIFLWPYAIWDWPTAKVLWAFSNLVFTGIIILGILWLAPSSFNKISILFLVLLFVMGTPWRNGVGNGQHALFVLAFFLLAVSSSSKSVLVTGLFLSVSWFKYSITLPLSLFFARSRGGLQIILVSLAIHIFLTIFAAKWTSSSPVDLLVGPFMVASEATDIGYLDLFALAYLLDLPEFLPAILALGFIIATYFAVLNDHDHLSCLSMLALVSMVVIFHRGYDFVVLIFPFSYFIRERGQNIRAQYYLVVTVLIWFVEKSLLSIQGHSFLETHQFVFQWYFWLKVVFFYGVILADWLNAYGSRCFEKKTLFVVPVFNTFFNKKFDYLDR